MALTTEEMAEAIVSGLLAEYTPQEADRVVARSPYLDPEHRKRSGKPFPVHEYPCAV
jgi:hypothetical protein